MKVDRLVDTNFLVDHWRRGKTSAAAAYARIHSEDSLAISWIVKAEFLRGAEIARHALPEVQSFLGRYPTHWPDEELLTIYAQLFADLRRKNRLLGGHDLWIAASALRLGVPLVTRNTREFGQVPGIQLDPY